MLTIKEEGLLIGIVKHCNKILQKLNNVTKDEFYQNDDAIEIVCFNILQIGELAKNFDAVFLSNFNEVPWKKITGMRDIVAHGYGTINIDIVWGTAKTDIVILKNYCSKILNLSKTIH